MRSVARLTLLSAVVASTLGWAGSPAPQAIGASAKTAIPSPDAQIKVLRQQLSALEGRVHELEKKAEEAKNTDEDAAAAKKVDQRLTAIERAQQKLESEAATQRAEKPEESSLSHAKAPFVVYDDEGHTIFRVELQVNSKSPRITVGNPVGAHVVIGANDEIKSAAIRMFGGGDPSNDQVFLLAGKESQLQMKSAASNQETILGTGKDGRYGLFLSRGENGSASLTSTSTGGGYLLMANSQGQVVAEGGAKTNGVGIFRTGPSCCAPPGAVGPHQYIVGKQ